MTDLNPLRPRDSKRSVSLETVSCQHEIEQRKMQGKREAYKRRNEMYVKAMYGSTQEKEEVKQMGRMALLEQIEEKEKVNSTKKIEKAKESGFAINYDRICIQQDKEDRINKGRYLQQFRNENKKLMELRAEQQRNEKQTRHLEERNLLQQTPINWSKTLH